VVAEIELDDASEAFARPEWLGEEVTDDVRYYSSNLAREPWMTWQASRGRE
jgi:adenylate cyclase